MLFVKGSSSGSYKSLAYATSHTLSLSTSEIEVSDKDTGEYGSSEPGQKSWEIQSENTYSQVDADRLIEAWQKGEQIDCVWNTKSETDATAPVSGWTPAAGGYEGKAIITSLSVNAPSGDKASYSLTLKGIGEFTKRSAS